MEIPMTTKSQVADELDALALKMRSVAAKMEDCDHAGSIIAEHAHQLAGAANMARTWALGIRVDKLPASTAPHLESPFIDQMQEAWSLVNAMASFEHWDRADEWLAENDWAKPNGVTK